MCRKTIDRQRIRSSPSANIHNLFSFRKSSTPKKVANKPSKNNNKPTVTNCVSNSVDMCDDNTPLAGIEVGLNGRMGKSESKDPDNKSEEKFRGMKRIRTVTNVLTASLRKHKIKLRKDAATPPADKLDQADSNVSPSDEGYQMVSDEACCTKANDAEKTIKTIDGEIPVSPSRAPSAQLDRGASQEPESPAAENKSDLKNGFHGIN